jgi:hypothetical protein
MGGYVYCVSVHDRYYKIGITSGDPFSRMRGLQVGCPYEISFVWCVFVANPNKVEKIIHTKYEQKRKRGEWFELSSDEVRQINKICLSYLVSENPNIEDKGSNPDSIIMFCESLFDAIVEYGHVSEMSRYSIVGNDMVIKDKLMNREIRIANIVSLIENGNDEADICSLIFGRC